MIQYTPKYINIVVDTVKNKTMSEGSFESVYSFDREGILGLNKYKNQSDTKNKGKWNVQIVYLWWVYGQFKVIFLLSFSLCFSLCATCFDHNHACVIISSTFQPGKSLKISISAQMIFLCSSN